MSEEIIDIRKIKINKDIYPRFESSPETVLKYRLNVDNLPPIELSKKDNTLLDGYHRYLAHRDEGRSEINFKYVDISESEYFLYSIKSNATHGMQLTREEKKKACIRLYEDWLNSFDKDIIPIDNDLKDKKKDTSEILAVSEEIIRQWTKELTDKIKDERKQEAWDLWLSCLTEDEIAKCIKTDQATINRWILSKKQEVGKCIISPDSLQIYNIWNIGTRAKTETEYPGRLPYDIMENLLYYYTEPFDIVSDPMAGGGTTNIICKKMSRRYMCYDLIGNELNNIYPHNILEGLPKKKGFIPSLIFLDPPYWKQMDKYTGHKDNIMNQSLDNYYKEMDKIIKSSYGILKDDGILAIIVSPTQKKQVIYDLQHQFYLSCEHYKFKFVNRIIIPYSTQQVTGAHVKQAKDGKYMLKLYRDLLIFKR